jgi:aspartate racemase
MDRGLAFVRAGEIDKLAQYFAGLIDELAAAGADCAVLPAITPHICIAELARRVHVPMINVMEVIAAELRTRGLKRVAAFGTRYTVESSLFGQLADVIFVTPKPHEIDEIHESYFTIVDTGRLDAARIAGLRAIARRLCEQEGAEAILLAGTELALVFDETSAGFPAVDCTRLHIEAIVRRLMA